MNITARLWFLLTVSYAVAHGLIFALVWRTIDLRLETVTQHVVIPFVQAAVLAWVAGAFSLRESVRAGARAVSRPLTAVVWCAEGALLFVYWGLQSGADFTGVIARTACMEALLAVVIILIRLLFAADTRLWSAILPFALSMVFLGSNGVEPWFNDLPYLLPEGWPLLLRQTAILGVAVVSLIALTGKARAVLSARSPLAGFFLGGFQLFFITAAMALAVNGALYAFPVWPWQQVIATSLSLAATCLLTAALHLPGKRNPDQGKTFPPLESPLRPMGLPGSWLVLAVCSFACVLILRILFFPHWNVSVRALSGFSLIPLIQASWLRWAQALYLGRRSLIGILKHRSVSLILICLEITIFGIIAFSENLWEGPGFPVIAAAWAGLKLIILGAAIQKRAFWDISKRAFRVFCGTGAFICGVATAIYCQVPETTWMMPALGAAFVLLGRSMGPGPAVGMAGRTAEASLTPILVMGLCLPWTREPPLAPLYPAAFTLVILSTTLSAVGFFNWKCKGSEYHGNDMTGTGFHLTHGPRFNTLRQWKELPLLRIWGK